MVVSALTECLAHFGIDRQICIALSSAEFRVFQRRIADHCAIFLSHIFVSGQGTHSFGKQFEVMDVKRHFAGLGAEHRARSLNKIPNVKHLIEEVDALLSQFVDAKKKLNLAGTVFDVGK